MERTTMVGVLSDLKVQYTQQGGAYYDCTMWWNFTKRTGDIGVITRYFKAYNEYAIKTLNTTPLGTIIAVEGVWSIFETAPNSGCYKQTFNAFKIDVVVWPNANQQQAATMAQNAQQQHIQHQPIQPNNPAAKPAPPLNNPAITNPTINNPINNHMVGKPAPLNNNPLTTNQKPAPVPIHNNDLDEEEEGASWELDL